jgi:hypothetical protein
MKRYLFYYVNFITNRLLLPTQFCQKLNEKAKIADSLEFRNHCWRELGIGQIANDPNVTDPERMLFARHTSANSHLAYVRPGHNSDFAFQKSVSGAPMPTKKKILLQQAATMRESKKAKGMSLKAKPKVIRKVARKATPPQAPTYMKAPPKKATRRSVTTIRRSARVRKPKKRL